MYNEAPMLADMVAAGDLPPVEERLPDNPLVLEPFEEIGTYGGTLRRGSGWHFWLPDTEHDPRAAGDVESPRRR